MRNGLLAAAILSVLAACGPSRTTDTGPSGDVPMVRTDAPMVRPDAPVSSDPCAAGMGAAALDTLGCNGGFPTGAPAMNARGGTCTPDMANPQGSCMAGLVCFGMTGTCLQPCTAGATYVSTGGCPTGSRCFDLMTDLCFGDCDATHPCPTGQMCDGEGSCY